MQSGTVDFHLEFTMFRLASLLGIACLAVAAVTLTSTLTAETSSHEVDTFDAQNRLPVSVEPVGCSFHAPFSLN